MYFSTSSMSLMASLLAVETSATILWICVDTCSMGLLYKSHSILLNISPATLAVVLAFSNLSTTKLTWVVRLDISVSSCNRGWTVSEDTSVWVELPRGSEGVLWAWLDKPSSTLAKGSPSCIVL